MTATQSSAIAGLALPLIAASSGGPPSTGRFFITVIVILSLFLVVRKLLPTFGGAPRDQRQKRETDPTLVSSSEIPTPSSEELTARLGRIRDQARSAPSLIEHVAPPTGVSRVDPVPASLRAQQDAIVFHQHFPPRDDALSYWGGVPLVPAGFAWPSSTSADGAERALHHIIQVDCTIIPEAVRLGLPDSGLLNIFIDLDWGRDWGCHVSHSPGDPRNFAPATIPDTLPNAYGERAMYQWVRSDEDWPRLLPRWSFDPVLVRSGGRQPPVDQDDEEERKFWPGTIDLAGELAKVDGAIVTSHYFQNSYGEDGHLNRPFSNFPHDWQAVRIAIGELAYQANRGHLDRFVERGDMTQEERDAFKAGLKSAIDEWTARAGDAVPISPLTKTDSDAAWQVFLDYRHVSLFALSEAVNQSIEATLSSSPNPANILPEDALALVRSRHALGSQSERGIHLNTPDHLLGPPSYVQGEADGRLREWLLLFEMSSDDPIGHMFAEGVYQFWIRPEDLAGGRFDCVELDGSAY